MKAEIISIGTELLLGDIVNSNAAFLGKELAEIGITLQFTTTVGDNKDRIVSSFQIAKQRADLVIVTGGLGPTKDDLTHEAISEFLGVEMEFREDIADWLKNIFSSRGREFSKSNLTQAYFPKGSKLINNKFGTAPGIIHEKDGMTILTFPGVPREMKDMWLDIAKPFLKKKNPQSETIKSKTLKFFGLGESALAEKVDDLLENVNPTVAPYAGRGEIKLRITAKAKNDHEAYEMIAPIEKEIKLRLGKYFFGINDDTLVGNVANILDKRNEKIAIFDYCTSGLASNIFKSINEGKLVFNLNTNNNEIVKKFFKLSESFNLEINADTALIMSEKIRKYSDSSWGLAIIGSSDSNKYPDKHGVVYIAVSSKLNHEVRKVNYNGFKKDSIEFLVTQSIFNLLRLTIKNIEL